MADCANTTILGERHFDPRTREACLLEHWCAGAPSVVNRGEGSHLAFVFHSVKHLLPIGGRCAATWPSAPFRLYSRNLHESIQLLLPAGLYWNGTSLTGHWESLAVIIAEVRHVLGDPLRAQRCDVLLMSAGSRAAHSWATRYEALSKTVRPKYIFKPLWLVCILKVCAAMG